MDRAQNIPGNFEENAQLKQVLQRQQPEGYGARNMDRVYDHERADARVVDQAESDIEGENREDFILTASDEYDEQRDLCYQA